MPKRPPRVLAIAGSDCSGGAGIQADIKTITMLGGYAMSAVTSVTAQNSVGVQGITPLEADFIAMQIRSCVDDIGVDAIKIGMVQYVTMVDAIAEALDGVDVPIVLDPVFMATSGGQLIDEEALTAAREKLFPLATLLTPNLPELEKLTGTQPKTAEEMGASAKALAQDIGCAILAKGGHGEDKQIYDVLAQPDAKPVALSHERIETVHTHGTGCTLSSAIATLLAHGQPLEHSLRLATQFVVQAIMHSPGYGKGHGPLGHYAVRKLG
ncbi:MAG: bifunctional hydroxymethylpyrimidine kinase/phosphomethylpyrimidine kinase [Erythrobacter sp.]